MANGTVPVLRVSVAKIIPIVEGMWFTLDVAAPVLTEQQTQYILKKMYQRMRRYITPARRGAFMSPGRAAAGHRLAAADEEHVGRRAIPIHGCMSDSAIS